MPFPQDPPLWAQVLTAVNFFVDDPERVTLDEWTVAASAFTSTMGADADDEKVFGTYRSIDIEGMLRGKPTAQQLKIEDFEIGKLLGRGGFGVIFLARHLKSGSIVALKRMNVPDPSEWGFRALLREINLQKNVSHEHVLKLHDVFVDKESVYLVLEYAPGGSLREVLSRRKQLPKALAAKYISDLCQAIQQFHTKQIIHRDIKPDNFLLGFDGKIKLADFGTSKYVPLGKWKMHQTQVGTPLYWAPEIDEAKEQDEKVDVWSLGICLYEFLVGKPPTFQGADVNWPDNFDNDAKDLIGKMLMREPQERIALVDIVKHSLFVSRA